MREGVAFSLWQYAAACGLGGTLLARQMLGLDGNVLLDHVESLPFGAMAAFLATAMAYRIPADKRGAASSYVAPTVCGALLIVLVASGAR